ncbi:hypothetical protein ACFOD0_08000 [Shewanella intestini]|uniref:Uncharacterized protein n=1 Tax=Shewanella intestini TaxID=2017544 RepID=A0ABS5HYG6_9GAMM|nr:MULTISPECIES: hypothetical protein [Shewanella]MBR9726819.1 hypothetical protein [Shewanella intestini]MRG34615.1 hypothetical protein [Shewanella sp. XMDDZSB0408]
MSFFSADTVRKPLGRGLLLSSVLFAGCFDYSKVNHDSSLLANAEKLSCSQDVFNLFEKELMSSDELGHGPDIGSQEWQAVIEFKLGLTGNPTLPSHTSSDWCDFIYQQMFAKKIHQLD